EQCEGVDRLRRPRPSAPSVGAAARQPAGERRDDLCADDLAGARRHPPPPCRHPRSDHAADPGLAARHHDHDPRAPRPSRGRGARAGQRVTVSMLRLSFGSWRGRLVLGTTLLILVELLSLGMLAVLDRAWGIRYQPSHATVLSVEQRRIIEDLLAERLDYLAYHKTFGWTIRPNAREASGPYRSNAQGLREDGAGVATPTSAGMLRIAAFGDSFTHGDNVRGDETWAARLGQSIHADVLNFGVPA